MTKALSVAELNKAIDTLNQSAAKLGDSYQEVGLLCLTHLKDHGDVGPVNRLIVGMPKSTRRLAMATWMVAHGALVPNQDQGTRDTMPLRYTKEKKTDLEAAATMKWWEAAPERNISDVFDLQVAIKQLIARAKGKNLQIAGVAKPHEAHAVLNMMAAGVGLSAPFDEKGESTDGKPEAPAQAPAGAPAAVAAAAGKGVQAEGPGTPKKEAAPAAKKAAKSSKAKAHA